MLNEEATCRAMGAAGRRYAERTFSPERAADRFIEAFGDRVAEPVVVPAPAAVGSSVLASVASGDDQSDVASEEPILVGVGELAGMAEREAS